jgi:hypothetical protein
MEGKKIIGLLTRKSEKGISTTIFYSEDIPEFRKKASQRCEGLQTGSEWTSSIDCSALKLGDLVEFYYSKGYGDKAILAGFKILPAPKTGK